MRDKHKEMAKCVIHSVEAILKQNMEQLTSEEQKVHKLMAQTVGQIYEEMLKDPKFENHGNTMAALVRSLEIFIQQLIKLRYTRTHKLPLH